MAEDLDDGEFWLPPKFLCDQDFPEGELTRSNSDMSESLVWSTESDEDDHLLDLNQRFAHSSLSDHCWKLQNNKWQSPTSPQSTLRNGNNALLHAATGDVGLIQNANTYSKPCPVFIPPNPGFYMNHYVLYQQSQFPQLKQQQQQGNLHRGQQPMSRRNRGRNASNRRPLGLSPSAWPTLQQSRQPWPQQLPGWGMRPVFLQIPAIKRQCSGTGVFFPRPVATPTKTLNKPACSTVIQPDCRVVQTMNHNLKKMEASAAQVHNRSNGNSATICFPDFDAAFKYQNRVLMAETQARQRWNAAAIRPQATPISNEVELPREWTY